MTKYFFFLGTEAELIKTFPVIKIMEDRGIPYSVIASGQNDISKSRVLKYTNGGKVDLMLSNEADIAKNGMGLFKWYFETYRNTKKRILLKFPELCEQAKTAVMVVHGDTISTVMGAYTAKKLGMRIAHIEAGLRSHHLFNPFPEEIDRILVDRISDYLFVPGDQGIRNLKKRNNVKLVNTVYNTLVDSLIESQKVLCDDEKINQILKEDYFVFVLHRQENMQNDNLIHMLMKRLFDSVDEKKCVVILHKITEIKLDKMGYLERLKVDERFILLPRTDYFDFMKLLKNAAFVLTDGGSNQGELSYMGVPTLIIRESTEQEEGIGENIVLYAGDDEKIDFFFKNYQKLRCEEKSMKQSVADLIVDTLLEDEEV